VSSEHTIPVQRLRRRVLSRSRGKRGEEAGAQRELNDAITWREAAEVKLTELAEFEEAHDGLTAQLAQAKALFSQMNTEIQNLRVRVKMEEEENQQLQNKLQTLKRQLGASTESSAAPSWA
jgi:capsule polysaccharide export protein KpsE/RkpR